MGYLALLDGEMYVFKELTKDVLGSYEDGFLEFIIRYQDGKFQILIDIDEWEEIEEKEKK